MLEINSTTGVCWGLYSMGSNVFERISKCAIVYQAIAQTNMHLRILNETTCRFITSWERKAHPRLGVSVGGDTPPKHFDHQLAPLTDHSESIITSEFDK